MPDQSAAAAAAAIKREVTYGTAAASGAGATQLRLIDSTGLYRNQGQMESAERRRDQLRQLGRSAGVNIEGSYNTEWTVGGATDLLIESLMRRAFTASITSGAVANVTTTTNTIVRAAGSWLTDGFREGMVITIPDDSTTANNNLRSMILSVTATVITVYGSPFTTNAVGRSVTVNGSKYTRTPYDTEALTNTSYTVEQLDSDMDESELFTGVRLVSAALAIRPRALSTWAWGFQGLDSQLIGTVAAPYFTSPSVTTGDPLEADTAYLYYKGAVITALTGMDLSWTIDASGQPVLGSQTVSDVTLNRLNLTATVTAVRRDFLALADYRDETEFAIGMILREPASGGSPRPFHSIYLPRVRIGRVTAPFIGGDGPKIETRELMFGPRTADADTMGGLTYFGSSAA